MSLTKRTFWLIIGLWWPLLLLDGILAAAYIIHMATPSPVTVSIQAVPTP